jgi:hypothetical protein
MVKELKDKDGETVGVFDNTLRHRIYVLTYTQPIVLPVRTTTNLTLCHFWWKDAEGTQHDYAVKDVVNGVEPVGGNVTLDLEKYAEDNPR